MENTEQYLRHLLQSAVWTTEDKDWLKSYLEGDMAELKAIALKEYEDDLESLTVLLDSRVSETLLESLHKRLQIGKAPKQVRLWPRIAVVAAVALVIFGIWFFNSRHTETSSALAPALAMNDIAPGKNGATLTLANGKVIQLSDAKSGVVIGEDKLAYNDGSEIDNSSLSRSDILLRRAREGLGSPRGGESSAVAKTAKGQTYIFTLPDGTKVWLNAASSLTIPSGFSGTESRIVELSGEAYFEVTKNKKRPFVVKSNGQEVTVLGTHFNVSAYKDEGSVKTTLLEGSVRVSLFGKTTPASPPLLAKEGTSIVLKPNQQSVVSGSNRIIVANVDASEAVAWKEGLFSYKEATLETVMRQVARWYDVEIIYETEQLKEKTFGGTVSRYDQVSGILNAISLTGAVKFKIQGKQIIVRE